jgi:hypothetical protein
MYNHLKDHHHINSHSELKDTTVVLIKHVHIAAMLTLLTTSERKLQRCNTLCRVSGKLINQISVCNNHARNLLDICSQRFWRNLLTPPSGMKTPKREDSSFLRNVGISISLLRWLNSSVIFNLGCRWRWVVCSTLWPLYTRGSGTQNLFYKESRPQLMSGSNGEGRNICPCRKLLSSCPHNCPILLIFMFKSEFLLVIISTVYVSYILCQNGNIVILGWL